MPRSCGDAVRGVHDPAVAKADGVYWLYSTGRGIPIRRSRDLIHWDTAGRVFAAGRPSWAAAAVPGVPFPWAPDVSYFNGRWHLYYALSTFASQRSVIGLATNATLDPADARYRWEDRGEVLRSRPGVSAFNAIDPAVAFDADSTPWLTWGSFWGGINLRRLDASGKPSTTDTTISSIASRGNPNGVQGPTDAQAIAGPYRVKKDGWYYLFVSWDMCCRGANSNDDVRGPGHNSVLTDRGRYYIAHHYINAKAGPASPDRPLDVPRSLQSRPLYWAWGDWPVAGEPLTPPVAAGSTR